MLIKKRSTRLANQKIKKSRQELKIKKSNYRSLQVTKSASVAADDVFVPSSHRPSYLFIFTKVNFSLHVVFCAKKALKSPKIDRF